MIGCHRVVFGGCSGEKAKEMEMIIESVRILVLVWALGRIYIYLHLPAAVSAA